MVNAEEAKWSLKDSLTHGSLRKRDNLEAVERVDELQVLQRLA